MHEPLAPLCTHLVVGGGRRLGRRRQQHGGDGLSGGGHAGVHGHLVQGRVQEGVGGGGQAGIALQQATHLAGRGVNGREGVAG